MWRELSCVWMRCGAACGQGLRTQRSTRMHFLLSAPSLFSVKTTSYSLVKFFLAELFCYELHYRLVLNAFQIRQEIVTEEVCTTLKSFRREGNMVGVVKYVEKN